VPDLTTQPDGQHAGAAAGMTIHAVRATNLELPYDVDYRPPWRPGLVTSSRRFTLASVRTEDGVIGWAGTDGHHSAEIERDVAPYLVGEDVSATERHARVLRDAGGLWFLETAFWDIIGKAARTPLYRLWGWRRDAVPAYASTAELGTPQDRVELALRYREQGFRAMELRFHHDRVEDDLALLDAVLEAVPDMQMMVDANRATDLPSPKEGPVWDYRRARQVAAELEQRGVLWLEEPLARYDFDQLARLTADTQIAIAGGEYNRHLHEFRWLLERGVYDIVQADGTVSEGLSQIRKVAAMAELFGRRFVPHHGLSGLGLAAMLHLACCLPGATWLEVMWEPPTRTLGAYQQLGGILHPAVQVGQDGLARPPAGPGLGIEVDEDAIERYAV
jgi:D-galactarolactone cycloisomerase